MKATTESQPETTAARPRDVADATVPPRRQPVLWVVLVVALVAVAFILQSRRTPAGPPVDWYGSLSDAAEVADDTDKPLMLNFTADWCTACDTMDKAVFRQKMIRTQVEDRFVPVKMDVSKPESSGTDMATELEVSELPTVVVLNRHGREAGRIVGAVAPEAFLAFMDRMSEACGPQHAGR